MRTTYTRRRDLFTKLKQCHHVESATENCVVFTLQQRYRSRAQVFIAAASMYDKHMSSWAFATKFPRFTGHGLPPCSETDPEAYFPEKGNKGRDARETSMVKNICRSCPYKEECLQWALENREVGIWGGTTDTDRRRMRKKRQVSF
jgi:WhiB family redox-sensing transcriptional regulator